MLIVQLHREVPHRRLKRDVRLDVAHVDRPKVLSVYNLKNHFILVFKNRLKKSSNNGDDEWFSRLVLCRLHPFREREGQVEEEEGTTRPQTATPRTAGAAVATKQTKWTEPCISSCETQKSIIIGQRHSTSSQADQSHSNDKQYEYWCESECGW
jgi:hypothetical protein